MSRWQANLGWGLLAAVLAGGFWLSWSPGPGEAQVAGAGKTPAPETLLPADAVLYIGYDGLAGHQAEFEKTAAYKSLYQTGLMDAVGKFINAVQAQAGEEGRQFGILKDVYQTLMKNGASVAVSVSAEQGPPQPCFVAVFHQGANFEPQLSQFVKGATRGDVDFQAKRISGRMITSGVLPKSPGVELGWWTEGGHLVVALGMNAVETAAKVAAGDSPNITEHPLWTKYKKTNPPEGMTTLSWLDLGALRQTFGQMPLPPTGSEAPRAKVNDLVAAMGLDSLGAMVSRSGFAGEAMWSETLLETTGPRKGLLALASDKTLTLKDLPPLPVDNLGFHAGTMDWPKIWANMVEMAQNLAKLGPPDAQAQVDGILQNLPAIAGFDPEADLFKTLGDVTCLYADGELNLFGMGIVVAQQVKDEKTFTKTLMSLLGRAAEQTTPRELMVKKIKKQGREIVTLEIGGGVFNPSFAVADGWFVLGLLPQNVESFYLRLDGKLDRWEPSAKHEKALAELPKEFTSITVTNPETGVKMLMGLAPIFMPVMQAAWQQSPQGRRMGPLPFSVAELPPAELVAKPLFPNVRMNTLDENGFRSYSRMSLPTVPLLDSGGGAPAVAIGIALLLPAVQQAREAARRTTSKNNLKQLGLALHNYHDVHNQLPSGTHPNEKLKVEKRLSWIADILPMIEQGPLFEQIDFDEAWDSKNNETFTSTQLPFVINPSQPPGKIDAPTNYVGIAGVGEDAPTLPANHKRAGMFGYNRATKFRDVKDGLSNTVMVSEASQEIGPWAQGGKSTLRSLTKKPYINGPDGLGGMHTGGCNMLMGDGSVRFVSENIAPETMEALTTIAGGEAVGDF